MLGFQDSAKKESMRWLGVADPQTGQEQPHFAVSSFERPILVGRIWQKEPGVNSGGARVVPT